MSRVSSLGGLELLGEVGDRLETFALILHENGANGKAGGISVNNEGELGVGEDQHGMTLHGVLEGLESGGLKFTPDEGSVVVSELRERGGDLGEVLDELAVVAGGTEERAHVSHFGRGRPFLHGFDLVVHHANAIATDMVTEELDLMLEELALGLLGVEFLLAEDVQHLANMVFVLVESLAEDENVVEEHEDELVEEWTEGLMHQVHERGGGVGQAEGEHEEFEVAVAGAEGGLRHVAGVDADLVVP